MFTRGIRPSGTERNRGNGMALRAPTNAATCALPTPIPCAGMDSKRRVQPRRLLRPPPRRKGGWQGGEGSISLRRPARGTSFASILRLRSICERMRKRPAACTHAAGRVFPRYRLDRRVPPDLSCPAAGTSSVLVRPNAWRMTKMPRLPVAFDHCVVHVSHWERSNAFYRDVLGAKLVRRPQGWAYRFGTVQLNLHGPGFTPAEVARLPVQPGNSDLCFEWDGPIGDAVAHLGHCGVNIHAGPIE